MSLAIRPLERIGPVTLSIQASSFHYCHPREDGLSLEEYDTVEVALWRGAWHDWITKPSTILETLEFDSLWGDDDVAPFVPLAIALRLRAALAYHYGEE